MFVHFIVLKWKTTWSMMVKLFLSTSHHVRQYKQIQTVKAKDTLCNQTYDQMRMKLKMKRMINNNSHTLEMH